MDRVPASAQLSLDARGITKRIDDWHGPVDDQLRGDLVTLRTAITSLLQGEAPELDYAPFSGRRFADGEVTGTRVRDGNP